MEQTGGTQDYGYLTIVNTVTENITLLENSNYWRTVPYYRIHLMNEDGTYYTNSSVTAILQNLLNAELTFPQDTHPTGLGLYTQPSLMVGNFTDGSYSFTRTQPVTLAMEDIYFYIGDPTDMFVFNVWITEYTNQRYEYGNLYVYARTPITLTLIDIVPFDETLAQPSLLENEYYYLEVRSNDNWIYTHGLWYTSGYSLTIYIVELSLDYTQTYKWVNWVVARQTTNSTGYSNITATVAFNAASSATMRLYNSTGHLLDTVTYAGVNGINYNYANSFANQSFFVRLNASIPGFALDFDELRTVGRHFTFGTTQRFPLDMFGTGAGTIDHNIMMASIVALFGLIISGRSRGPGLIVLAAFTGMFVYNGWLDLDSTILYVAVAGAVLYTIGTRGNE